MYRILISDPMSADGLARLSAAQDVDYYAPGKMNRADVLAALPEYEGLIVRSETKVDAELLSAGKRLCVVGRAGVGLDNIDLEAATQRGVIVMNTPGANSIATCEHTLAMMLALCRKLPAADASVRRGEWTRSKFAGVQLYRKILGVIGFGRIGREVATRAQAFGMTVLAYDPYINEEIARDLKVEVVDFDDLLTRSDFITLHTSLTPETRGLIGFKEIARLKSGARLINCARGELVDEAALIDGLQSGKLAGAAVDVYSQEPPVGNPLLGVDNVVLAPHLGANTVEAQRDVSTQIVDQVIDALRGVNFRNAVNLPFVDGAAFVQLRPYLSLAEKIGSLQVQLAPGRIKRLEIEVRGPELADHIKPATVALLRGLLAVIQPEEVNYINAPVLATDHGIVVSQAHGLESPDYPNLLTCRASGDGFQQLIAGMLFSHEEPRLVQVNEYRMDARPEGRVLVMVSHDVPGVIGRVGTLLGEHGINIAEWRLGRNKPGGTALSFINLDNQLPQSVIEQLLARDEVISARQVSL